MLVLDSFSFNGEPIVQFRLKCMYPYVDIIYIIESWYTHSDIKKEQLFYHVHREWFLPYMSKIQFIEIHEFARIPSDMVQEFKSMYVNTKDPQTWYNEHQQRNAVRVAITALKQDFILIVSDVDEILAPSFMSRIQDYALGTHHLNMQFYYYSWKWRKPYQWHAAFITTRSDIDLSKERYKGYFLRDTDCIADAGWHLSYFMSPSDIVRKLEHFAHTEFNQERFKGHDWVELCMKTGLDVLGSRPNEQCVAANQFYPIAVLRRSNMDKCEVNEYYELSQCDSMVVQLAAFITGLSEAKTQYHSFLLIDGFTSYEHSKTEDAKSSVRTSVRLEPFDQWVHVSDPSFAELHDRIHFSLPHTLVSQAIYCKNVKTSDVVDENLTIHIEPQMEAQVYDIHVETAGPKPGPLCQWNMKIRSSNKPVEFTLSQYADQMFLKAVTRYQPLARVPFQVQLSAEMKARFAKPLEKMKQWCETVSNKIRIFIMLEDSGDNMSLYDSNIAKVYHIGRPITVFHPLCISFNMLTDMILTDHRVAMQYEWVELYVIQNFLLPKFNVCLHSKSNSCFASVLKCIL